MPRGRRHQTPEWAKEDSETRILEALSKGPKTNQQLLDQTKLSEPTLAARIKELEKNKQISYLTKEEDRRSKIYSLTSNGTNSLVKKRVTNSLCLTSLLFDFDSLKLKVKNRDINSHISAFFELKNRKSKVLEKIERDFLKQFRQIMEIRHPEVSKSAIGKNSEIAIKLLLDKFDSAFQLNVFSSLKMRVPGTSEYRVLSFDPFYPTVKLDFYALLYVDLFEHCLELIYDTFKTQYNGNLEEFLIALDQGPVHSQKMTLVMSFDLGCIPWQLKHEESFYNTKE